LAIPLVLITGMAAAVEVIHQDGNASQILQLDVDGVLWNVTFVYGSADAAYPGDVFEFETEADAIAVVGAVCDALNPFQFGETTQFPTVGPDADGVFYVAYEGLGDDVSVVQGFLAITDPSVFRWLPDSRGGQVTAATVYTYAKFNLSVPVESASWSKIKALYK